MRGRLRATFAALTLVAAMGSIGVAAASPATAATCTLDWQTHGGVAGFYAGYYNGNTINTKQGQRNSRVTEVQCVLIIWADLNDDPRLSPHGADGIFGGNTETAVENAQRYYLFPGQPNQWDGEVGPATWPRLRRMAP